MCATGTPQDSCIQPHIKLLPQIKWSGAVTKLLVHMYMTCFKSIVVILLIIIIYFFYFHLIKAFQPAQCTMFTRSEMSNYDVESICTYCLLSFIKPVRFIYHLFQHSIYIKISHKSNTKYLYHLLFDVYRIFFTCIHRFIKLNVGSCMC